MKKITLIVISLFAAAAFAQWTEPDSAIQSEAGFGGEPWISNDGQRMYVTNNVNLYVHYLQDEPWQWSAPQPFPAHINNLGEERSPCESPTGDTLYFSSWDHQNPAGWDIFFTVMTDTGWGPAQNAGPNVNDPGWQPSVGISRDGSLLLVQHTFSISYHVKQQDGTWGERIDFPHPEPGIEDEHPTLSPDNTRLFFAHRGTNNGQIMESRFVDGEWQPAVDLPYPVNNVSTTEWAPCMLNDGRTLVFQKDTGPGESWLFYTTDTTVISDVADLPEIPRKDRNIQISETGGSLVLTLSSVPGNYVAQVHDILGREIKNERIEFSRTLNGASGNLSLPVLPIGIYIVSVQTKESLFAAKYLIIH